MKSYGAKFLWVLLPIAVASMLAGVLYYFDYSDANVVIRTSLLATIVGIGVLIALGLFFTYVLSARSKRLMAKQLSQQSKHSQDEHKRFVQRLDHELKNPLTSIQVGLETLKRNATSDRERPIDNLLGQTKRLSQLTTDLRKIAVLDEQDLEFEKVSVSELLEDVMQLFSEIDHDRNIELVLPAVPWPVPNINADRDLLELALYNVIDNAIKYSNSGDRIEIRASDNQRFVNIEISDTGLGLPKAELDQVWEELFRGSNTLERSGVGIGLSLVKKIVERHQGDIEFESKSNIGSRVSILLPITNYD